MLRRLGLHLVAGALSALGGVAGAQAQTSALPFDFQGRMIVSVSDADMVASAYSDDALGPRDGRDALSVIRLGGHPRDLKAVEIEVSNAVVGPPAVLAVTPDGRFAIVIETLKQT